MTKDNLLSMDKETVFPIFLKMAQYTAKQCTGCSDSPLILAFKAQQAMLAAHEKGENPIQKLNDFLGTRIQEDVYFSLISDTQSII